MDLLLLQATTLRHHTTGGTDSGGVSASRHRGTSPGFGARSGRGIGRTRQIQLTLIDHNLAMGRPPRARAVGAAAAAAALETSISATTSSLSASLPSPTLVKRTRRTSRVTVSSSSSSDALPTFPSDEILVDGLPMPPIVRPLTPPTSAAAKKIRKSRQSSIKDYHHSVKSNSSSASCSPGDKSSSTKNVILSSAEVPSSLTSAMKEKRSRQSRSEEKKLANEGNSANPMLEAEEMAKDDIGQTQSSAPSMSTSSPSRSKYGSTKQEESSHAFPSMASRTFAVLESLSTLSPSSIPSQRHSTPSPTHMPSTSASSSIIETSKIRPSRYLSRDSSHQQQQAQPAPPSTPAGRRLGRLKAFEPRASGTLMMAADVQGMGRIIMPRVDQFDASAGSYHRLQRHRSISNSPPKKRSKASSLDPVVVELRMGSIRSWLESPELSEEELKDAWTMMPKRLEADLIGTAIGSCPTLVASNDLVDDNERITAAQDVVDDDVEIHIGGKSISILTRTKRRREEIDTEGSFPCSGNASPASSSTFSPTFVPAVAINRHSFSQPQSRSQSEKHRFKVDWRADYSSNDKGKSKAKARVQDEIACICGRGDDGEAMIRCDGCEGWYHLECLNMATPPRRKDLWTCHACIDEPNRLRHPSTPVSSKKKKKTGTKQVTFSSPVLSSTEPILVATSLTPRPSGSFYRTGSYDLSLVAAPHSTPVQKVATAPRTPIVPSSPSALSQSSTPLYSRADYSPRSPLLYRSGRSRLISGTFDEPAASVSDWADQSFVTTPSSILRHPEAMTVDAADGERMAALLAIDEEDFLPSSWYDATTTPSRSLATSLRMGPGGGETSASQDFLSNLHSVPSFASPSHHSPAYLQRLFAGSSHPAGPTPITPSTAALPLSHYLTSPSSPLGPRHRRYPSASTNKLLSSPVARSAFYASHAASPTKVTVTEGEDGHDATADDGEGGSSMMRTGSGLGIGFNGKIE